MAKKTYEIHSLLGRGAEFDGLLKFEGSLQIDGPFKGEIQATGSLVVSEGARVEADIQCDSLVVHGEIIGNMKVTKRLEAIAPARMTGDIRAPVLVINDGVFFEGNVKMGGDQQDETISGTQRSENSE
jgi:cytoskeletal protein CcmA (bactofilin family)